MRVLAVGGNSNFPTFAGKLQEHGIEVVEQWEFKAQPTLPKNADGVMVIKDSCSHNLFDIAKRMAHKQSLPFVAVPGKISKALPVIVAAGFVSKKTAMSLAIEAATQRKESTMSNNEVIRRPATVQPKVVSVLPKPNAKPESDKISTIIDTTIASNPHMDYADIMASVTKKSGVPLDVKSTSVRALYVAAKTKWIHSNFPDNNPPWVSKSNSPSTPRFIEAIEEGIQYAKRMKAEDRASILNWLLDRKYLSQDLRAQLVSDFNEKPGALCAVFCMIAGWDKDGVSRNALYWAYNDLMGKGLGPYYGAGVAGYWNVPMHRVAPGSAPKQIAALDQIPPELGSDKPQAVDIKATQPDIQSPVSDSITLLLEEVSALDKRLKTIENKKDSTTLMADVQRAIQPTLALVQSFVESQRKLEARVKELESRPTSQNESSDILAALMKHGGTITFNKAN